MKIDKTIIEKSEVIYELFHIFYEDRKAELENDFLSQNQYKNFTEFCIEKWREFDKLLFTD